MSTRSCPGRLAAVLAAAAIAGGLVACGGDDVGEAFCEAALAIGAPGDPDVDFATASAEEVRAAEEAFIEEQFQPHVDEVATSGPEGVRDDAERLSEIVAEATADPESDFGRALFFGEGAAARSAIVAAAAKDDGCDWNRVEVSAVDYAFDGVADSVPAGTVAFELTNDGDELHEMVVVRKVDDEDRTFAELLELPEEEAQRLVTFVTAGFSAPGATAWSVGELEAGEHALLCFIPVGTVDEDQALAGDGPPHHTRGMVHVFTVE
ncbi:MAG TPA: hypothetical protein VMN58_05265 [Acidimicrobiales bacterium]|nr:hypothetical protein [Acidimicrobiales bacterium]